MSQAPQLAFSHVGLHVHDLAAMERFYTRFMRFFVTDRGALDGPQGKIDLVFLSRDPREHHQVVLVSGRPADVAYNVINQLSFRVDGLASLRLMHDGLGDEPVTDVVPICHGNAISVYFRDPEGNRVELFVDTPWYVHQPLRIPLDLDLDDAALWRWLEDTARRLPGFKSRSDWEREMQAVMASR